jgi:4-hydroxy-3-methylbut-2-en-1-yl diphosphate reductase
MIKIDIAKDAGYCSGVKNAIQLAFDAAEKYGIVYMLGDIVHNESVVNDLAEKGVVVVKSIDDIPNESHVLFRAHGTISELWDIAREKKLNIIDATCPLVHEIHREAIDLSNESRQIVVIGDQKHDEVIGIASKTDNPIIVSSPDDAEELRKYKKIGVVVQSTQLMSNVQAIVRVLLNKTHDLRFVNTICHPTTRNQEQIVELANNSDVVVVIGSFTSANSKRLTQLALKNNKNTYQVTCADELDHEWFVGVNTIGISAGASTPDYLIEQVKVEILKYN